MSHMDSRCTTQCWRAASVMVPSEAEMMDKVCHWEWTPRAWGHRRSTALPPLPSVSTGWAQTHDRAWGSTLQDQLQQCVSLWGPGGGGQYGTHAAQEFCTYMQSCNSARSYSHFFPPPSCSSMMVNPLHLHCRGNLIPMMFALSE